MDSSAPLSIFLHILFHGQTKHDYPRLRNMRQLSKQDESWQQDASTKVGKYFQKGKSSEHLEKCNEAQNQTLTRVSLFSRASAEFEQRHVADAGPSKKKKKGFQDYSVIIIFFFWNDENSRVHATKGSLNAKTLFSIHMNVSILLQGKLHRPLLFEITCNLFSSTKTLMQTEDLTKAASHFRSSSLRFYAFN